jgi:polar amino acid transport system substrate-binding protein
MKASSSVVLRSLAAVGAVTLLVGVAACSSSGGNGNQPASTNGAGNSAAQVQSGSPQSTGGSGASDGIPTEVPYAGLTVVPSIRAMLPESIQKANQITQYINVGYVPMEFYPPGSANKTVVGVDVDIIQAMAKIWGVTVNFHNVAFADLFTGIQSGRSPYAISGAYDAASRRGSFTFVDYLKTFTPIVTSTANASKYNIEDFKSFCGKTLTTDAGTDYIQMISALSEKYCGSAGAVKQVISNSNAQDEINITDGRAVACFCMGAEAASWFVTHTGAGKFVVSKASYYPTEYGAIALKSNTQMIKAMQAALQKIMDDGVYMQILNKWKIPNQAITKATINAGPPIP